MLEEWLQNNYFKDKSGKMNCIIDSLGDCFAQATYVIGGNSLKKPDFYKAYLNESTIELRVINDQMCYLGTKENVWNRKIVSFYRINGESTASEKISGLLQSGKIAIISPIVEKLPFEELYDPDYKENKQKSEHFFSIISEDENNFYFIDNPAVINKKNFVPYEKNEEIGIINKEFFEEVSKGFCIVGTPLFNLKAINKAIKKSKDVFKLSYKNYNKKSSSDGKITTLYGREALKKLADIFASGRMQFSQIAPSGDRDLITYFRWRIWHIKGRRNLQVQYLKDVYSTDSEAVCDLKNALEESIKSWGLLNDNMYKDFLKGKPDVNDRYIPLIDRIINAETELHSAYHYFLKNN